LIGKIISHYEIIEKLGEGGMGVVYRARDQKLGRDVALKVLPPELAADAERRKRFEREARAIAALKHPNIVTLYSVEEAEGLHFITMEHVEGGTLADDIVKDGLPLDHFFELAIPLADALAKVHAKGIAHRDIKPSNIMHDADGRLKVLDFGLAKLFESNLEAAKTIASELDSVTAEGRIIGTVAYMSPEQAEGQTVDARSDVFSLGVVLYEMATGKRPFQGKTNISTISAILKDEPPPVDDLRPVVPRHLGRIVARCLAKDPSRRYQSALDVRNELEGLEQETTSQLGSQSEVTPMVKRKPGRARRWVPWTAGIAVLAVVAVVMLQRETNTADNNTVAQRSTPSDANDEKQRIVVLPFENLGAPDDAYFAAGITEEITSRLARVRGLSVMSRTSAVQYDRTGKTVRQIGEELGVDYVLEGSVRWEKRGDEASRVRVTPQLIRATDDSQVWANSYDRSMNEIFRVQSEIAEQVVGKLNVTLVPTDRESLEEQPTDNLEAWHAFQRGQALLSTLDLEDQATFEMAVKMFGRAAELDPEFVRAHGELARAHAAFVHWQWDQSEDRLALAKASADRALELDPDSPWAHLALGYYYYHGRKDYERAWKAFREAQIRLGDDAEVYSALGYVRRRQGQLHDALDYFKKAAEIARLEPNKMLDVAETLALGLGRFDDAHDYQDRQIALAPDMRDAYVSKAWSAVFEGDIELIRATLASSPSPPVSNSDFFYLYEIQLFMGDLEGALESASSLSEELTDHQIWLACRSLMEGFVYYYQGKPDLANASFESARVALEERVRKMPDDARSRSALGLAYAGLGRAEDAVREGEHAVRIYPRSRDAFIAPVRVQDLAVIHVLLGQSDRALELIEQEANKEPWYVMSPGWLKFHPHFSSLRDHPRFQALLN